jgi:Na+/H+ antiporter NhaC
MFELSTEIRYFDVRDFVIRVSVNSGIFHSGLCCIIDIFISMTTGYESYKYKITKVSHTGFETMFYDFTRIHKNS